MFWEATEHLRVFFEFFIESFGLTRIVQKSKPQNRRSQLPLLLSSAALVVAVIGVALSMGGEKIGIVRTADLVADYKGMEDARKIFEDQQKGWQNEIDTLEADFRQTVNVLNAEWSRLSKSERAKRQELVGAQEQNLVRYSQTLEARVQEEESRLIEGVLNQVNGAVREYAKEHGFDVIYGATTEGSILHAEEHLDITDGLLEELNANYSGGSGKTDNK
ncbi:MAG: OmpH family outer membrane protein [Chlorobi bacterium]|nr:OmpH family outer membrane protein [Chlorobiota bacterium]